MIFDMRGFWADERKDAGLWNISNPIFNSIYSFFKRKEKEFVTQSDAIVSLTRNGKEEILSWNLLETSPIQVIPCCADLELFDYNKINQSQIEDQKKKLGIEHDSFILTYLGSIGTWYMLDEMLDFFKELLHFYPNAVFQFITKEPPEEILLKAREKEIPSNHFVIKAATRNEVPIRLAISDVSIFFIRNYYSKKASSPTKQAETMGLGVPIICNSGVGDVDTIVEETNSGLQIEHFSNTSYNKAVRQIPFLLTLPKQAIRDAALAKFNLQDGVLAYKKIYQSLIQ